MIDHVGFTVSDYPTSLAFYKRALAPLGYGLVMEVTPEMTGNDSYHAGFGANGAPGLRPIYHPHYHPHYYGAFVLDPNGHNIEAVCHAPEAHS